MRGFRTNRITTVNPDTTTAIHLPTPPKSRDDKNKRTDTQKLQTMPNPFHFRARIDRLVRQGFGDGSAYLCVKALDTLVRELHDHAISLLPPLPLGEGRGEGPPLPQPPNHADSAVDAISSPINNDAVAPGLGAFRM